MQLKFALPVVTLLAAGPRPGPILSLIDRAGAVVIAQSSPESAGSAESTFRLTVVETLKGTLPAGELQAVLEKTLPPTAPFPSLSKCGIFFLARSGKRWHVLPQSTPQFQFDDYYFPSNSCAAASERTSGETAPAPERVLAENVRSVRGPAASPQFVRRLFSGIRPRESRTIAAASRELSRSSNPNLRLLGLGWRIVEGDSVALDQLAQNLDAAMQSGVPDIVPLSVNNYSSPNPTGARALGKILNSSYGAGLEVPLSMALRSVHNRETLPSLYKLLDSANAFVRQEAVGGLSLYLLGAAPLTDANQEVEFDRATNPGTRKALSDEQQRHIHFGSFPSAASETETIQWWKAWYRKQ